MCDTGICEVCYFSVEPLGMDISYLVISADVRRNAYTRALEDRKINGPATDITKRTDPTKKLLLVDYSRCKKKLKYSDLDVSIL